MLRIFRGSFLTVPVFVRRAYAALEALTGDEYRARKGDVQQLVEEVVPVAALLKALEIPGRHLRCKYVGGASNHDAQIKVAGSEVEEGSWEPRYFIEVTTAISPHAYLRREALNRYGSVFGGPNIERVGSKRKGNREIVSRATAQDMDAPLYEAITWVQKRLAAKATKEYPRPCILVVNVEPDRPLSLGEWSSLARSVYDHVNRSRFAKTFIVEWFSNMVFPI